MHYYFFVVRHVRISTAQHARHKDVTSVTTCTTRCACCVVMYATSGIWALQNMKKYSVYFILQCNDKPRAYSQKHEFCPPHTPLVAGIPLEYVNK